MCQKQITVSTLIGPADGKAKKRTKVFDTTTLSLNACRQWLQDQAIEVVAMESTGQYWRPVWTIITEGGFRMILCNPRIIRTMPGRKTDRLDAEWIADLDRYGIIPSSYVPTLPIIELRESTRARKAMGHDVTKYKNRVHNILQRPNIKLTSYVADIFEGSGRKLLNLLLNGEVINLDIVAACMHGRMKHSPEQILLALDDRLSANDRQFIDIQMAMLDSFPNDPLSWIR
ncbi:IS110 family transposase [Lacticaseibacillus paracasei]|uniref:IS110 family transposase n=1 Tax=Lacticaseibacillus paracasei TaxID=1597 RepID=UPI0021D27EA0|nr:transposase [Lacticaseibacillus paracasei]MCU6432040.1 transposase [Lacticaseibacillus paracasei]